MNKEENNNIAKLKKYLLGKKKRLNAIRDKLNEYPHIYRLFEDQDWFSKVEGQIAIWEKHPMKSLKTRDISVPEYELFRYFSDDSIFRRFLAVFDAIEGLTKSDKSKYGKWKATRNLIFSENVSQIYAALFEILVLGKLIASNRNVEPYYQNIDGRIEVDKRFIYFEIKSLQKSRHDLSGVVGSGSIEPDKKQIFRALRGKAKQLYHYRDQPTLIFLSLFRLADMFTGEIYTKYFLATKEGLIVSGVCLYSWFTAENGKFIYNEKASNPLTKKEKNFFIRQC